MTYGEVEPYIRSWAEVTLVGEATPRFRGLLLWAGGPIAVFIREAPPGEPGDAGEPLPDRQSVPINKIAAITPLPDPPFIVRTAAAADCDGIAEAHVASIRSLGPTQYDSETIDDWASPRTGESYARAMARGELFLVAFGRSADKHGRILGFSSYRCEAGRHRTAVYVRGDVARSGIGSALFSAAEGLAKLHGAEELHVDASLVSVPFYRANGFEELARGEHELPSGKYMACVYMRKHVLG